MELACQCHWHIQKPKLLHESSLIQFDVNEPKHILGRFGHHQEMSFLHQYSNYSICNYWILLAITPFMVIVLIKHTDCFFRNNFDAMVISATSLNPRQVVTSRHIFVWLKLEPRQRVHGWRFLNKNYSPSKPRSHNGDRSIFLSNSSGRLYNTLLYMS